MKEKKKKKKKEKSLHTEREKKRNFKNGRVRNRTGDLSHAKGARYRLRHTPIVDIFSDVLGIGSYIFTGM